MHREAYDNAIKSAEQDLAARDVSVAVMLDRESAAMERDFIQLVLETTQKIIGDMQNKERMAAIAARAYERFRDERQVTVKVHPEMADSVRNAIDAKTTDAASKAALKIIADPLLSHDDCIIQTQRGITRAGLDSQLAVLHRGLTRQMGS